MRPADKRTGKRARTQHVLASIVHIDPQHESGSSAGLHHAAPNMVDSDTPVFLCITLAEQAETYSYRMRYG